MPDGATREATEEEVAEFVKEFTEFWKPTLPKLINDNIRVADLFKDVEDA